MPLTVHDSTGLKTERLQLTTGGQLVTDRYGMSTARAVWWYYGGSPESQVGIFSRHPRWAFLELDKRTITRRDDGSWDIVGDYFGVEGTPQPIYSLDINTSQEPIETHPKFKDFAGTETAPLNGAVFDQDDNTFTNFKQVVSGSSVTNLKWVGVRAYLNASAIWRETKVTKTRPTGADLASIGKITAPAGSPPTPAGGGPDLRNWLYGSMSYEQKGLTFTTRKEWLLSGPGGWNSELYAS